MKILCHVGPWCKDQFEAIALGMDAEANVLFVSGYWELDETGFSKAYYDYVDEDTPSDSWADERDEETILRCRLLRSFDRTTAHRHVRATRRALREMLQREKPDALICESIDQFLHDILFQEAAALEIRSFGLIRTFVNGYYRISERGELTTVRQPSPEEVAQVRDTLVDRLYLPGNLLSIKRSLALRYVKVWFGNHARVVYFSLRRRLSPQKYNYHFWSSSRGTRLIYQHWWPRFSLGNLDWRDRVRRSGRKVIFIPLQHFPEATVDYWSEDVAFVNYPRVLLDLLKKFSKEFHVVVKEHPGVWGFRKPEFYSQLEAIENVTICPTNEASQSCIELSDSVLVWTGTVGFEAALRGKPVLTVCSPYYMSGPRFMRIGMGTNVDDIKDFIDELTTLPVTGDEQLALVEHLMEGIIPGRFQNDGSYDPSQEADIRDARNIGRDLRQVYDTGSIK